MESRNNPLVDAVSSSVSSDLESSEMPRDPESIQTEPNHKHVPNADDKSDLTQWDTPLVKPKMPEEIAILIEKLLKEEVPDKEQPSIVGSKRQGTNKDTQATVPAKVARTEVPDKEQTSTVGSKRQRPNQDTQATFPAEVPHTELADEKNIVTWLIDL
ncbi:hypothetical protein OS493_031794 [Desmophyllum pertusum]|uniref:Uncharacterized protein n=1 Tax=Desmophyllum pertusum TaxID=174260 RepID=A0A9X0CNR8_9CNID|nr:hypothetical protein OS493_031794 [Desmophyllum pertusum]